MNVRAQIRLKTDSPTTLANATCPYCGVTLSKKTATKDHVIGRRFVPREALSASWNLILRTCKACNNKKSDLEDDISAITMASHTFGLQGMDDERLQKESIRKASRSVSRKTRKSVSDSGESVKFESENERGWSFSANFTGPPQLDEERVLELARLQMMGFFYLITYNTSTSHGYWWPGEFHAVNGALKSDWGNSVQRSFASEISQWDYRFIGTFASGYVQVLIRRHPSSDCWAWALEWNDSYRVVGLFGDKDCAIDIINKMPPLFLQGVAKGPSGDYFRFRTEIPISEEDDKLFIIPENAL